MSAGIFDHPTSNPPEGGPLFDHPTSTPSASEPPSASMTPAELAHAQAVLNAADARNALFNHPDSNRGQDPLDRLTSAEQRLARRVFAHGQATRGRR